MVARSTPISSSAQAHKAQEDLNREILVVNSVTVDYPGVRALDAVSLAFRKDWKVLELEKDPNQEQSNHRSQNQLPAQ